MGVGAESRITQLVVAVVRRRDLRSACDALVARGVQVTGVQSTGGFLSLGSSTLLIAVPQGKLEEVIQALDATCRSTVEYLEIPGTEGASLLQALAIPVTIRGATVFVIDVDRCVESKP